MVFKRVKSWFGANRNTNYDLADKIIDTNVIQKEIKKEEVLHQKEDDVISHLRKSVAAIQKEEQEFTNGINNVQKELQELKPVIQLWHDVLQNKKVNHKDVIHGYGFYNPAFQDLKQEIEMGFEYCHNILNKLENKYAKEERALFGLIRKDSREGQKYISDRTKIIKEIKNLLDTKVSDPRTWHKCNGTLRKGDVVICTDPITVNPGKENSWPYLRGGLPVEGVYTGKKGDVYTFESRSNRWIRAGKPVRIFHIKGTTNVRKLKVVDHESGSKGRRQRRTVVQTPVLKGVASTRSYR